MLLVLSHFFLWEIDLGNPDRESTASLNRGVNFQKKATPTIR